MDDVIMVMAEVEGMPEFRDVLLNQNKVGYFVYIPDADQWLFSLYGHPAFISLTFCQRLVDMHTQLQGIKPDFGKLH